MTSPILYCGDTSLDGAAAYLAGLMSAWGWDFDYVPSPQPVAPDAVAGRKLVVLSDYPASKMGDNVQQRLVEQVAAGCGLLMIGGWESFHGAGGDWDRTRVASVLPVEIQASDDRVNCDQPALIRHVGGESPVSDLPWAERPPGIGGFNRLQPRSGTRVVLEADRLAMSCSDGDWNSELMETHPLLVLGRHGAGRTAAIATDVAPHWVGGFVDWGEGRVCGEAAGGGAVEVGDLYARFWRQLLMHLQASERD